MVGPRQETNEGIWLGTTIQASCRDDHTPHSVIILGQYFVCTGRSGWPQDGQAIVCV